MIAEDVAARLVQAEAMLIVTDSEMVSMVGLASVLAGVISIVSMDPSRDDLVCLKDLVESDDASASHFKLETTESAEAFSAFINRTSGSTGNMKSVITTHAHDIATMEVTRWTIPEDTEPDRDNWLSSIYLGFFIVAKLHMSLNVLLDIPVVIMREPLDEATIDVIRRHRITFVFMMAPVAAKIAKFRISSVDVSSIRWLLLAGASVCGTLREAIAAKISVVDLTLEWGTSETMLIAIQADESSRCPGSSGTLVGGIQAKVFDTETGEELGERKRGEILVGNSVARFAEYKRVSSSLSPRCDA
jgi:4-coumarate--CoA ligase